MLRWLRAHAAQLLERETRECRQADVQVSRVGVGDPVSRWGSFSAEGYTLQLATGPRARWVSEQDSSMRSRIGPYGSQPGFHALVTRCYGADPRPARCAATSCSSCSGFGRF